MASATDGNSITFPIANRPLSNNSTIPRNTNAIPKPAKPTPISVNKIIKICYR